MMIEETPFLTERGGVSLLVGYRSGITTAVMVHIMVETVEKP